MKKLTSLAIAAITIAAFTGCQKSPVPEPDPVAEAVAHAKANGDMSIIESANSVLAKAPDRSTTKEAAILFLLEMKTSGRVVGLPIQHIEELQTKTDRFAFYNSRFMVKQEADAAIARAAKDKAEMAQFDYEEEAARKRILERTHAADDQKQK